MLCHYPASAAPPLCHNQGWQLSAVALGGVALAPIPVIGLIVHRWPRSADKMLRAPHWTCRK